MPTLQTSADFVIQKSPVLTTTCDFWIGRTKLTTSADFVIRKSSTLTTTADFATVRRLQTTADFFITESRGTFRGTMSTVDRDALDKKQPKDTVVNIDPTGKVRPKHEFWTGSAWLQGGQQTSGIRGESELIVGPTTAGWRVEIGDPTYPIRFWDGSTSHFLLKDDGEIRAKSLVLEGTGLYGGESARFMDGANVVGVVGQSGVFHARTLKVHSSENFSSGSDVTAGTVIVDGTINLGSGSALPDWLLSWQSANAARIANGDSLEWGGGTALARLDDGGYIQLTERTNPATPAANKIRLFCKDNGGVSWLHWIDDAGTVHQAPT
jgi:hypothetical protein